MTSIDKWSIVSHLNESFLSNIRFVSVFGTDGNDVIMVTKDDNVFMFGTNLSLYLGLGNNDDSLKAQKIKYLCKKGIIKFAHGSEHIVALSIDGNIYTWGKNYNCQLGNGNTDPVLKPIQITSIGKKVVDIMCGLEHTLVLTDDKEVYAWGYNYFGGIGSGIRDRESIPMKLRVGLDTQKVISIACGRGSSLAVLETGEVFGWGHNSEGMLGMGNNISERTPTIVENLNGVVILKVVCGYSHTLLLSNEGNIYTMGKNNWRHFGIRDQTSLQATKITTKFGQFIDIAASKYSGISAAVSKAGKCYMWGLCRGHIIKILKETPFKTMHEIFANFSTPAVTYTTVDMSNNWNKSNKDIEDILHKTSKSFNDISTSDLIIRIKSNVIYVHKTVLLNKSEHFRSMFTQHWDESKKQELEITQYSYHVYYSFLQYLYTNEVNIATEYVFDLLDLANAYCETHLKCECEQIIRNGVTIENAAMVYSSVIKLDAKELEDYCFQFALHHLTAFVQTKAFKELDKEIITSFFEKAALNGVFKH